MRIITFSLENNKWRSWEDGRQVNPGDNGDGDSTPTSPTDVSVSNVTNTTATLTWTASTAASNVPLIGYRVLQAPSYNQVAATVAGTTTANLSGLTANTPYEFVVVAYNTIGTSDYSDPATFTTLTTGPVVGTVPTVPNSGGTFDPPTASNITQNAVTLTWGWSAVNDANPVTNFRVYEGASVVATTVAGSGAASRTTTITGLSAGSTHTYTVKAVNSIGESAATLPVTITTLSSTAPPTNPTNLTSSNVGTTTATVTWTASTADVSAPVQGYRIYNNGSTLLATIVGQVTTRALTGLASSTTYNLTVRAYNSAGESGASNTRTFTTQAVSTGTTTIFGASLEGDSAGRSKVGGMRVFFGSTTKPTTVSGNLQEAINRSSRFVWLSSKTFDAAWHEMFLPKYAAAARAANLIPVFTTQHEPDNGDAKVNTTSYHQIWDAVVPICRANNITSSIILTGFEGDASLSTGTALWNQYYRDDADICGFDRYNKGFHNANESYNDPASIMANVMTYVKSKNKPFAIGETGTGFQNATITSRRPEWARNMHNFLAQAVNRTLYACWFDARDTIFGGTAENGPATAAAWFDGT